MERCVKSIWKPAKNYGIGRGIIFCRRHVYKAVRNALLISCLQAEQTNAKNAAQLILNRAAFSNSVPI